MDLPAILFLFLRNFYHSSTATPVAIDMTVVVQDMLLCFLFTDLYGFSMKVHSQEEEDPSHDQDQDWEENGIIIVLFVQILPKILKVNMAKEVEHFHAANQVEIPEPKGKLFAIEPFGFFAFFLAIALGCLIGAVKIPGINFSLGNSGGCLIGGLIVGHFAHIGGIDCRIKKDTLNFMRELGLVLFLIGAGVPGGVNFIDKFRWTYFLYGAVMTTVPMIAGYIIARYVFKLSILNNLGSITGGMTSTPALGTLIATAGTDEVSAAYAATYPFALVSIVLAAKIIIMAF